MKHIILTFLIFLGFTIMGISEVTNNKREQKTVKKYRLEQPPVLLYYGISLKFLKYVTDTGIGVNKGKYHELFSNKEDALKVVKKQVGEIRAIGVNALKMYEDGYKLYIDNNGYWYTKEIPKEYLNITYNKMEESSNHLNTPTKDIESCDNGNVEACYNLAMKYYQGKEVLKDKVKAKKLFLKSCKGGYRNGCYMFGNMYVKENKIDENLTISIRNIKFLKDKKSEITSCNRGFSPSCYNIGYFYSLGKEVDKNISKAKSFFAKACAGEYRRGCYNVGEIHVAELRLAEGEKKTKDYYKKTCDNEDMIGCFKLAYMYNMGEKIKKNIPKAIELYSIACKNGVTLACLNLGNILEKEQTEKSVSLALRLYKKACSGGERQGCIQYKRLNYIGIPINDSKMFFNKTLVCAKKNNPKCMFDIVSCYMKGYGVEKNVTKMHEWAIKLGSLKNPSDILMSGKITSARAQLARIYRDGIDTSVDLIKSYAWFLIYNEYKRDFSFVNQQTLLKEIRELNEQLSLEDKKKGKIMAEKIINRPLININKLLNVEP